MTAVHRLPVIRRLSRDEQIQVIADRFSVKNYAVREITRLWTWNRDTLDIGRELRLDEEVVYNVLHAYREMRSAG